MMKLACILLFAVIVGICQSASKSGKDSKNVLPVKKIRDSETLQLKDLLLKRDAAARFLRSNCHTRYVCRDISIRGVRECCTSSCGVKYECTREGNENRREHENRPVAEKNQERTKREHYDEEISELAREQELAMDRNSGRK